MTFLPILIAVLSAGIRTSMTLSAILIATLVAGIGSVWLAAGLLRLVSRVFAHERAGRTGRQQLLSLAAGALLATSFMHLLPEAFESQAGANALLSTLLAGVVFFFLLGKAQLWHHGHEHPRGSMHPGGWAVLAGDSIHCFGDGILIASAFEAGPGLGLMAALAVLAHEVPHHVGDLTVLRFSSTGRRAALAKVSLAGAVTALGGLAGWWLVDRLHGWLPYLLVVASSSFIYVALADLVPQLQIRLSARETGVQVACLLAGIGIVGMLGGLAHAHAHAH
jgi:zinc and cadmium transporter